MKKIKKTIIALALGFTTALTTLGTTSHAYPTRGGYSQNDVTIKSGLSEENIKRLMKPNLKHLAPVVYELENSDRPINALFMISIMRLETGNGTSRHYWNANNVGGIMHRGRIRYFNSKEESLRTMHDILNNGYINQGRRNVWNIGSKYCVGGNWSNKIHNMSVNMMYKIPALEGLK